MNISTLTNQDICKGPAYAEFAILSYLSNQQPISSSSSEKYRQFIDALNKENFISGKNKELTVHFYLGYFHERAGLSAQALEHYQYLNVAKKPKGEEYYYAQWHSGNILHALGHPWPIVEEAYIKAYTIAPTRGESLKAVVHYYCSEKQWTIAYIYSTFCKDHFHGHPPVPNQKWEVDWPFYQGNALDMHTDISHQIIQAEKTKRTSNILL